MANLQIIFLNLPKGRLKIGEFQSALSRVKDCNLVKASILSPSSHVVSLLAMRLPLSILDRRKCTVMLDTSQVE